MASNAQPKLRREPLWDRADRNRLKMTAFVGVFVLSTSLLVAASFTLAPTWVIGLVVAVRGTLESDSEAVVWGAQLARWGLVGFAFLFPVLFLATAAYCSAALRGSRDEFAAALGAIPPQTDEPRLAATRSALADAMTVTGAEHQPRLYVMPDAGGALNACAFGQSRAKSGIAVTFGFAEKLPVDEQRALLSALLARIGCGDAARATAFVAIMVPLVNLRDADNPFNNDPTDLTAPLAIVWDALAMSARVLTALQKRGSWLGYEKADAEAMLALRDPVAMLRALDTLSSADTTVAINPVFQGLFVTALDGDSRVTTEESARMCRMREVLGVDGALFEPQTAAVR